MKPIRTACALFLVPLVMCLILPAPPVRSQGKKPPGTTKAPPVTKTKIEVKQFSGDFEQWVKSLTINSAEKLTFRYSTDQPGAASAIWQVSDKSFSSGPQITAAQAPHIIASGALVQVPGPGQRAMFQIDFAQFVPKKPLATPLNYWVFIVTKNAQQQPVGVASAPVKITYQAPGPATKFAQQIPPSGVKVFALRPDKSLGRLVKVEVANLDAKAVWESLGGQLGAAPAVCRWDGKIYVVGVSPAWDIYSLAISSDGKTSGWSPWHNKFSSRPACTGERYQIMKHGAGMYANYWDSTSMLHVFGRGWSDNQIWHPYYFDGHWAIQNGNVIGGESWGGETADGPASANFYRSWRDVNKRLHQRRIVSAFVKGSDGYVWKKSWEMSMHETQYAPNYWTGDATTSKWGRLGGIKVSSSPSAFYFDPKSTGGGAFYYVFARGEDGAVWYLLGDGGSDWVSLGGKVVGTPAACRYGQDVHVFARSPENQLLYKSFPLARFFPGHTSVSPAPKEWTILGGSIGSDPACVGD